METIDLGKDTFVRDQEQSRACIANGIGLGMNIMRELLGRELGSNPEINLEDHLSMVIGGEIEANLRVISDSDK